MFELSFKVLKPMGFRWDGEKIKLTQVVAALVTVLVYSIVTVVLFFDPKIWIVTKNGFSLLFKFIFIFGMVLRIGSLLVHLNLSLFYRRLKRIQFYEAFEDYRKLLNEKVPETLDKREMIRICISVLFYIYITISYPIYNNFSFSRSLISACTVLGDFAIFQNQIFLSFIIFSLRKQIKRSNNIIKFCCLNPKAVLQLKMKFEKVLILFNESFGLIIIWEVMRFLIVLTMTFYLIVGKRLDRKIEKSFLWYLSMFTDILPRFLSSYLIFYESEKLKEEVCTYVNLCRKCF